MSSAAHQFGRVEFWMLVFNFFHCACTDSKYSIFKIGHVQIDELPRTLEKIVACLIMFWSYVWWNEISSHPVFPLSSPMAVDCSVAQFWQSRPRHPSIRNWEILPRFRVRELSNGWGTLYHWVTPWYTAPGEKHSTLPSSSGSIWIDCTNTQSHLWFELSRLQISFAWSSNQIFTYRQTS